jgi:flagellar protein FliS
MIAYGAQAYRQVQVTTASPPQLVVQLYEGAIRFVDAAIAALNQSDLPGAHAGFIRAEAIIAELRATLNEDAGEIVPVLRDLYDMLYHKLVLANVRKDATIANEVRRHLAELLSAWQTAARESAADPSAIGSDRSANADRVVVTMPRRQGR